MRLLTPRRWPLALRVPLLITLLMMGVASASLVGLRAARGGAGGTGRS
jgi:hypothetical protein